MPQVQIPAPTRAPRLSPAARRAQLLNCALELFAQKGLDATTHTDIAQTAGVALPTVFHYFPQRVDLEGAALAEVTRYLLEDIVAPHVKPHKSPASRVESILMEFCDAIDSHPSHIRIWLAWSTAVDSPRWAAYLVFYRDALAGIARILEPYESARRVSREDAARVVVGLAHMITHMKFSGSPRHRIQRTVRALIGSFLSP